MTVLYGNTARREQQWGCVPDSEGWHILEQCDYSLQMLLNALIMRGVNITELLFGPQRECVSNKAGLVNSVDAKDTG